MSARLMWERDGHDWPNRNASRFVQVTGLDWHAQVAGEGPVMLLLHGTGSSSHSWRDLFSALSQHFKVIAPDLPGHGFTQSPSSKNYSLSGMARSVAALLKTLNAKPAMIVGHSAGAAIAIRMALDGLASPATIVGINAALLPYHGSASPIYSGIAKLMNLTPIVPWAIAMHASIGNGVERVLDETGSQIDARGMLLYRRLAGNPGHVSAALRMMANWDLATLERELPKLDTPLHLLVGSKDRAVPPKSAFDIRRRASRARITTLPGLGHLAHEENPAMLVERLISIARDHAIIGMH